VIGAGSIATFRFFRLCSSSVGEVEAKSGEEGAWRLRDLGTVEEDGGEIVGEDDRDKEETGVDEGLERRGGGGGTGVEGEGADNTRADLERFDEEVGAEAEEGEDLRECFGLEERGDEDDDEEDEDEADREAFLENEGEEPPAKGSFLNRESNREGMGGGTANFLL
jgi:hypothetical protein